MKNKLRLLFVLFTLLIASAACKHTSDEHLSAKTMKKILIDMHLAEAYSTMAKDSLHRAGTKNYDSLAVWYKDIFRHCKITQQQFTESLNWYKSHPTDIDSMYTDMLNTVTKLPSKSNKLN